MKALIIREEENSTPSIVLDKEKNKMEISGVSLPEDVISFYKPVLNWVDEYLKEPNPETEFNVKLTYFNTSSSKILLEILSRFEQLVTKGLQVTVHWHYPDMDEDLLATGKEFQSMLNASFNFIPFVQN